MKSSGPPLSSPSPIPLAVAALILGGLAGALGALILRRTQVEEPASRLLDRTDTLLGLLLLAVVLALAVVIFNA